MFTYEQEILIKKSLPIHTPKQLGELIIEHREIFKSIINQDDTSAEMILELSKKLEKLEKENKTKQEKLDEAIIECEKKIKKNY